MSEISRISDEIRSYLDYPPKLYKMEQHQYVNLPDSLSLIFSKLEGNHHKVGFLLQFAYFKETHRFFKVENFWSGDIESVCKTLGLKKNSIDLSLYLPHNTLRHKKIILNHLGMIEHQESKEILTLELAKLTKKHIDHVTIIKEIVLEFKKQKRELPPNYQFAKILNSTLVNTENQLLDMFYTYWHDEVSLELKNDLLSLMEPIINEDGMPSNRPILSKYKKINQSYKPKGIKESTNQFLLFKGWFEQFIDFFHKTEISQDIIQHYAIWLIKAKTFQLKQRNDRDLFFYLACFIYHHYHLRQDALVAAMIKGTNEQLNKITKKKEKVSAESEALQSQLNDILQISRNTLNKYIDDIEEVTELSTDYKNKLERIIQLIKQLREKEKHISDTSNLNELLNQANEAKDKLNEYTLLEEASQAIQNRTAKVLLALDLSDETSNPILLSALNYFRSKDAKIDHRAPTAFLEDDEVDHLYGNENEFRKSLYKALLIKKSVEAIRSGVINLKTSYKYLKLDEYLIPKHVWLSCRKKLLKEAALDGYIDIETLLNVLKKKLNYHFRQTNKNINTGKNKLITFDKDGLPNIRTLAVPKIHMDKVSSLFKEVKYTSILEILDQINNIANYTDSLKHHSIYAPKVRPEKEIFYAALLGLGCNIGSHKLASTSKGVTVNKVENVENWYLSKDGLHKANDQLIEIINALDLPTQLTRNRTIRHTSSDGMQKESVVESLNSNQSYKYSGISKGVSVYTFIDDRCVFFHSTVISPEEREAAYVIDGLNKNDVVKSDIHSTDTHGYTEIIFGITYLLKIAFAPRLKGLKKQALYGFDSLRIYNKLGNIQPKKVIKQDIIISQWDEVLRLVASIKLRYSTASQIFKRLSSYATENPLYSALKEFGRILKTIFLLIFFDDLQLRQSIQKQLNVVELSNKFSSAVFFDKNGQFSQETKEEQEIAVLCKQLIQNAIILWNYLYVTKLLMNSKDDDEYQRIMLILTNGSVMSWGHINMYGEYDFNRKHISSILSDIPKILSYQVLQ